MSFIIWIVLGSIALFVAIKLVGRRAHMLLPAAALAIAGLGWASASSAAPSDAWGTAESIALPSAAAGEHA